MARKKLNVRKSSGTAAIQTVNDDEGESHFNDSAPDFATPPTDDQTPAEKKAAKSTRKKLDDSQSGDNVSVADIRKAAAFSNSVGGLDKAISLLQILKVAKDVR